MIFQRTEEIDSINVFKLHLNHALSDVFKHV